MRMWESELSCGQVLEESEACPKVSFILFLFILFCPFVRKVTVQHSLKSDGVPLSCKGSIRAAYGLRPEVTDRSVVIDFMKLYDC